MTENAFPFEGAVEESAGGDRRKMVLLAGVGALLVAVLGYFVVMPAFSGGDSDTTSTAVVKKPQAKAPAKKPAAKKKAPVQPAQYNDLAARSNPFHPLYVEPKEQPVAAPPPAAAPATTDTAPPTTSTGSTGGTSGGGSTTTVGTQRVALMTVFSKDGTSYAQTKVGEVVYVPKVGQVFAGTFKLLAVSGKTATYLYGDEQFTLSVGQEVLK